MKRRYQLEQQKPAAGPWRRVSEPPEGPIENCLVQIRAETPIGTLSTYRVTSYRPNAEIKWHTLPSRDEEVEYWAPINPPDSTS